MKKHNFQLLIILVASFLNSATVLAQHESKGILFSSLSFEKLQEKAASENKLIFIDAYTSWCGPCKWMTKEVFPDSAVGAFYNKHFICSAIDMEKGEGITIANKYNVRSYPAYLFIDGKGTVIHRSGGSKPAALFIEDGRNAMDPKKNISGVQNELKTHPDNTEALYNYISSFSAANLPFDTAIYNGAFRKINGQSISDPWLRKIALFYGDGLNGITKIDLLYPALEKIVGKDSMQSIWDNTVRWNIYNTLESSTRSDYPMFRELAAKRPLVKISSDEFEKLVWQCDMTYNKFWKDGKAYIDNAKVGVKKYVWEDAEQLNSIAWDVYELSTDNNELELADSWVQRSISLQENYFNLDTRAWIQYKLGNKTLALELAKKAIEAATSAGENADSTKELLDKLK